MTNQPMMKALLRFLTSRSLAWGTLLVVVFTTCRPKAQTAAPPDSHAAQANASATPPAVPPPSPGARIEDERNAIGVFRTAAQSTVFVTQTRLVEDYLAGTQQEVPAGSGSGFIWDDKGTIVT